MATAKKKTTTKKKTTVARRKSKSNAPAKQIRIGDVQQVFASGVPAPIIRDTLKENLKEIKTIYLAATTFHSYSNWWIGKFVAAMQEEPGKYGAQIIDKVAKALGRKGTFVYSCLHFFQAYQDSDVEVLGLQKFANLEFSHFAVIARLSEASKRNKLLVEADKNKMTVEDVKRRVRELGGGSKRKPKSDSSSKKQTNAIGSLGSIQTKANKATVKLASELQPIKKAVAGIAKRNLDAEQQEEVESKMEELRQTLVSARVDIDENLQVLSSGDSSGTILFRQLKDTLNRHAQELKQLFPQITTELKRMVDVDQVSEEEFSTNLTMFRQAASQASKLRSVCETIVDQYHGLAEQ